MQCFLVFIYVFFRLGLVNFGDMFGNGEGHFLAQEGEFSLFGQWGRQTARGMKKQPKIETKRQNPTPI